MHSTLFLARQVVFPASATYNVNLVFLKIAEFWFTYSDVAEKP